MSEALSRALLSLQGLSIGDAFGEQFYSPDVHDCLLKRQLPPPVWAWTDDTEMALSVVAHLHLYGKIEQNALASSFAHHCGPTRAYSRVMASLLGSVAAGANCKALSSNLYEGRGSFGNGAAMRVAPLGAYFAGDISHLLEQARLSAEITHVHPEGIAGAQAVAVAAALATLVLPGEQDGKRFLGQIATYLPVSEVREKLLVAAGMYGASSHEAVLRLGCGECACAQDTVPFALWCAARHIGDYAGAMWTAATVGGDRDTLCAIAGGVVALTVGYEGIPVEFRTACEKLPAWFSSVLS